MEIREISPTGANLDALLALSALWAEEGSCYGYCPNGPEDIEGRRVWAAWEGERMTGYLFGIPKEAENMSSILPDGTAYFEVEELYVLPDLRSKGMGGALFSAAEIALKTEGMGYVLLSTASKNFKAVLRFYIDRMGMDFWSARLFKKL